MGRNPATGEAIKIPAKTVVKMRPAKSLKEAKGAGVAPDSGNWRWFCPGRPGREPGGYGFYGLLPAFASGVILKMGTLIYYFDPKLLPLHEKDIEGGRFLSQLSKSVEWNF